MRDLKTKTIKGMFWSFSEIVSLQGINFVVQIFLARLLMPEDFGLIGMITIFIAVSQSLIDSGFTSALIREKNVTNTDYSTVFYFNLVVSVVIYFILFFSSPLISNFYNEPRLVSIIRILSVVIIINAFGLIQRTILIRELDFKTQTKITFVSSVLSGIVAIILAFLGLGVWALVIRQILMQLTQSLMLMIHNKWIPSLEFNVISFKHFFGFGWKLLVSGLIDTLYTNIYYPIIGKFFSATDLGFFTNAKKMNDIPSMATSQAVQKVSYPVLSQIQDNEKSLKNSFRKAIKNTTFINFPLMMGLAAIADPLIKLLIGEKWAPSIPYFQILCFTGILYPLHALNLNILQVKGRSDLFLKIEIFKKIIGIISIIVVLFFGLGIIGLLWAQVFTNIISFFINSFYSKRMIGYSSLDQIKDICPTFFASMIMAGVVYSLLFFLHLNNILLLLIQIPVGILVYILLSHVFQIEEVKTIKSLLDLRPHSNV